VWQSASGTLTGLEDEWHHIAMSYTDLAGDDPKVYLDGVQIPLTETASPSGDAVDYSNANLMLGNVNIPSDELPYNFNGYIKDVRIYNRILTPSEVLLLASDENGWHLVPDG